MQCGLPTSSFSPSCVLICWIGVGSQYMPSPARVAYAFATSSGVDAETPSVNAPHWSAPWSARFGRRLPELDAETLGDVDHVLGADAFLQRHEERVDRPAEAGPHVVDAGLLAAVAGQ
jgi:hypothetical protein